MGRPPKKKDAAAGQAAQGKGPHKRTPQSAFDPVAGKDIYEPERIVAERMAKGGVTQYQVKWKDYDTKSNTWEPLQHLAGCEDMIADFKEREKQRLAELDAAATEKHAAAKEAAAKKAAADAATAAAARVAAQAAGTPEAADAQRCPPCDGDDEPKKEKATRRSSLIWTAFDQTGCDKDHAACKLPTGLGDICGEIVSVKAGPTVMWNHTMYKHKADYIRLKGTLYKTPSVVPASFR